jgi:tetratricopeptide (TPR) repeat protein
MYSGATDFGKKLLMDALNQDPDLSIAQKAIKNFKNASAMKEQAAVVFKEGKYAEAIEMFDKCLAFDPLNLGFGSIINLNKSIALGKLNKNEESLKCLNLSL